MATEYEVNIKLNTSQITKDLNTIGGKIKDLGKTQNTKAKKALSSSDAVLKKEIAILAAENKGLRLKGQINKLEKDGFSVRGQIKKVEFAIEKAKEGQLGRAELIFKRQEKGVILRKNQLATETKITEQRAKQAALSTGIASPVFGKPTQIGSPSNIAAILNDPTTSASPVQQALKEMEERSAANQKQAMLNRKKSLSLGKANLKIVQNEVKAESEKVKLIAEQNKLDNRIAMSAISPSGPFSRLDPSDRKSRDAQGKRTFMNNPFAGFMGRRFGTTRGFDAQSALISGGFPLLFGQGPVTAAAGALGGGIGGMFGQMGGFAGGIAATALVQSINQALTAMSELGKAMGPFTQNSQALTDSLGLQGSAEEARIKLIEQSEGKTAAFNASMQLMTTRIGEDGVKNLEKFGETTRLLGSEMALATTQLYAFGAAAANAALNFLGLTEKLNASAATRTVADAAARGDTAAQGLVDRRKQIEAMGGQGGEGARKQAALDVLEAEEKIFAIRQNTIIQAEVMAGQFNSMVRSLEAEKEEAERLVELREKGLNPAIAKTIAALEKEASLAKKRIDTEIALLLKEQARIGELGENDQTRLTTLEAQKDKIDESVEGTTKLVKETENLNDKAKETVDAFTQLRDTIAQDIGNGLKDLITGAKSLNEVLSNILANMANQFLNLGIFGNFAGTFTPGSGLLGKIFPKADGGPVKAGGKYIVGERGPELFVPDINGKIIPNHKIEPPKIPDIEPPEIPNIKIPEIPNIEIPEIPNIEPPKILDIETPEIPDIEPPEIPNIEIPEIPDIEPPKILDIEPPKIPDIEPPKIPDIETPEIPDFSQIKLPGLAKGGPVLAGGSYLVGEKGPELFTPKTSGMITANEKLNANTVNNMITVNVDASGSSVEGDETQAEQLGQAISQAIQAELIQQQRPGGLLYS